MEQALANLEAVKRDPGRRRQRGQWERAIASMQRAAKGSDRAPALLEAARARYALYRFSQVESDRDAALRLARAAERAGAPDSAAFAAAVRREMGEPTRPAPAPRPAARALATAKEAGASHPGAVTATGGARIPGATPAPRPMVESGVTPPAAARLAPATPGVKHDRGEVEAAVSWSAPGTPSSEADEDEEEGELTADPVLQRALAAARAPVESPPGGPAGSSAEPARLTDLRSWSNEGYRRVALYLSRPVAFTRQDLPADETRRRRLALDLSPALLGPLSSQAKRGVLVEGVRAEQRADGAVRVELDLKPDDQASVFALEDPPRLIVDLGGHPAEARAPPGAPVPAAPAAARGPETAEEDLARAHPLRRIVVDAGHGGHDTGAIGPTRVREKDVTLALALRLRRALTARGYEVVLTRQDDTFVPLEERAAIANARHGDLFISLHANAHPHRDRQGVGTWVLEVADGRYAKRLAARENGAFGSGAVVEASAPEAEGDVRRILTDLDAQSSSAASRRLAEVVQRELCAGIRARVGGVRDLGVRSALFYVLLGARMPAVLVESSFISNRVEEGRLASPGFQDEVAASIARAVETFARREERLATR